ncbi:hypothetical protein DC498_00195 [Terrimonas sp.]|uniref:Ca2+-dependent phosphoinositide-specific phospholipase C n=1 Tax=Terrimonas sp. TaxID=1914338 RepID=UPI000D5189B7|nr:Ca2+-dependent phosphoinositide-specific phospholipase C [Terrimonas sp.]PVD53855.1 hypothetical protein DC498_00195 [Terrimonas sp.]
MSKYFIILSIFISSFRASSQQIEYNKNYSLACHNCYLPNLANKIEDVFSYTTSIEIDIWDNEVASGLLGTILGSNKMNKDWYVKHEPHKKGNLNCCGGTFQSCLSRIKLWSDENPNHNVITIFIDKKENWSDNNETRKPSDLDDLILRTFTKEKIFTPFMLLKEKTNLKEALLVSKWPTLDSLKGKFIFVITNGTEITSRNPLDEYLSSQKQNSICFVAPEIHTENEIANPLNISQTNSSNVIFYNLKYNSKLLANKLNSLNYLSRVYGSPETIDTYNELVKGKVNFIAIDNYKLAK